MKKIAFVLSLISIGLVLTAIGNRTDDPSVADIKIIGSWRAVKTRYGNEPPKVRGEGDFTAIKMFTATRWSGTFFNVKTKVFDGAGGGTYKLKGDQYQETIEYFSWDAAAVGQTAEFKMTIENGLLHQFGVIEYKGDKNYVIEEWYERIE